ncbi:anthrone oxygenase family protein [Streptomyces sp. SID13031]|uniref:anthrone oxygenase family protein n=1 Tax=Streptomyces sp. SID13031 TaxID=2706046 RepID=UPI0013C9099C|nr:anthrone oxygenase family protein [Streptomyces sp. SID13031]NEA36428.1 DUF1772 domain-containing protein [Streptomyces sp. SID13031]
MNLTKILILVGLVGSALMGGLFFAFGTSVMSSLQRMPAGQGATAMNLINVRIQNPLFLLVFCGTALVCVALAILGFVKDSPGKWWLLAGSLLYLVGVIVVSFAVNIPLNDQLAAVDPNTAAGAAEWLNYLAKWNPANNLRAITSTLAVVAFALALHAGNSAQADSHRPASSVSTVGA